jgi:hypothetical protein
MPAKARDDVAVQVLVGARRSSDVRVMDRAVLSRGMAFDGNGFVGTAAIARAFTTCRVWNWAKLGLRLRM